MPEEGSAISALERLKLALLSDAATLKWKSAANPSSCPPASASDVPVDLGAWRSTCYRHLAVLRPILEAREVAAMTIELSRDPVLVERDPVRVAIDVCRLLERSRNS